MIRFALIVMLVAAPLLLTEVGGYGAMMSALPGGHRELDLDGARSAALLLPALLLVLTDANVHQRFSAARTPAKARASVLWAFGLVLVLQVAVVLTALAATALTAKGAVPRPGTGREQLLLVGAAFDALPAWLGPLFYAALLALVLSTASTFLLTPACTFTTDLFQRFLGPELRADKYAFMARASVPTAALIALYLATSSDAVQERARFLTTLYAGGLAPCLLAAYVWPRATSRGALVSMFTALLTGFGWDAFTRTSMQDDLHQSGWVLLADLSQWATRSGFHPLLPAIGMGTLALVTVSLLSTPPESDQAHAFRSAPDQRPEPAGGDTSST